MNLGRAQEIVGGFAGKRVLVLGDMMLDEYIWGSVSRISPEAPVMVVDADYHTFVPGGAANVVNNLCALGARASIAGLVGQDAAGLTLREKLLEEGADVTGLLVTPDRPTTQKTRILAHSQQVVRVDHEKRDPIDEGSLALLKTFLDNAIPQCDAVLLSDYKKGFLSKAVIAYAAELAGEKGKIITGNLKPSSLGGHCRLTMVTMNHFEAGEATGYLISGAPSEGTLHEAGRTLLRKTGAAHVLVTQREHGLTLFSPDTDPVHLPAHRVEVFDPAGAGDTTISTLTLALASGATAEEAVRLANAAGAVVVKKVGVATLSPAELLAMASAEEL